MKLRILIIFPLLFCLVTVESQIISYFVNNLANSISDVSNTLTQTINYDSNPQSINSNSCGQHFSYRNGLLGLGDSFGLITISNPDPNQNKVKAVLTVARRLISNDYGDLTLFKSKEASFNDVMNGRSLQLKVRFPIQYPQPKIHQIIVNERLLCSAPKEVSNYVTTLTLTYTFTTSNLPPQENSYNGPYVKPQPPPQTQLPYYPPPTQQTSEAYTHAKSTYQTTPPSTYQTLSTTRTTRRTTTRSTTRTTTLRTFPPQTTTTVETSYPQFNVDDYLDDVCGVSDFKRSPGVSLVKGGNLVGRGQLPWLVAYFYSYKYSNMFICGGSLISKKLVVTAAHCIQELEGNEIKKPELSTFYMGKNNIESLIEELHYVTSIAKQLLIHPLWKKGKTEYENDIAIAVLVREIEFNKFIKPICIWRNTDSFVDIIGKTGIVAGWGKTEIDDISTPSAIYTKVPAVSNEECLKSDRRFYDLLSDRSFCAGIKNSTKGPCNGDSGGAFVIEDNGKSYLRGIISASFKDVLTLTCDSKNYAVFTDVSQYNDWIGQNLHRFG